MESMKEAENGSMQSLKEHDVIESSSNQVLKENQQEPTNANESETISQALETSEISSSSLPKEKASEFQEIKTETEAKGSIGPLQDADNEKCSLYSAEKVESLKKVPVDWTVDTKHVELLAYLYAEGLAEIPQYFFEVQAKKSLLLSVENATVCQKLSKESIFEMMLDEFTVQLHTRGLIEVPSGIFDTKKLKFLNLNNNEIKTLPKEIGLLKNLEILSMEGNQLTSLPPEICLLKKLRTLNLSYNQISSFPQNFSELSRLRCLLLSHNNIEKINFALEKLERLEMLELSGNNVTLPDSISTMNKLNALLLNSCNISIFPKIICYIPNLNKLSLSENQIQSLPKEIKELKSLKDFSLSNNKLTFLPVQLFHLVHIEKLRVDNNQLESLSDKVENLEKLCDLNLAKNLLKIIPDSLCNCIMIECLNLNDNQLREIPSTLYRLKYLKELYLNRNQLILLDEKIAYMKELLILEISGNVLMYIPIEIKSCTEIIKIDLSYNKLAVFPLGLCALAALSHLNLSGNYISEITIDISFIKNLQHLNFSKNKLLSFSIHLCTLSRLSYLDLSNNEISNVPTSVHQMQCLQVLLLYHNKFTLFPRELCVLSYLKVLDLSENKIQFIPDDIKQLSKLKVLNLSDNQFASFPNEICQLLSLQKLTLSQKNGLRLKSLTEEISKLTSLKELDISHNELQEIPESIGDIQSLVTLIANNNCLTQLPSSFSSLCNLQHLNLRENKLVYLPSDMHLLLQLKDIDLDENTLIRPPLEVCKGKQLLPIIHYLENADQRDAEFVAALRQASCHCEFPDLEDRLRDRLVCGLMNRDLEQRLFAMENLTFQGALKEIIADEAAGAAMKALRPQKPPSSQVAVHQETIERPEDSEEDDEIDWLQKEPIRQHRPTEQATRQYKGAPISLNLDPAVTPIRIKSHRMPFALKPKIDAELDKLVQQGVLQPMDSSLWETPLVTPVESNGDVHICTDYKCTINKALQQHAYPVPVVSHILASLQGGCLFAELDLRQAYQQQPVDNATAEAQTIITHRGTFRVCHLQFGIDAAGIHPSEAKLKAIQQALRPKSKGDASEHSSTGVPGMDHHSSTGLPGVVKHSGMGLPGMVNRQVDREPQTALWHSERTQNVLEKIFKTISKNIPLDHLDHFCRKMQLDNDTIVDIENNRSLTLEGKVAEALNSWKTANQNLSPAAMVDHMIRILIISGRYYLSNKIKALKLCSRLCALHGLPLKTTLEAVAVLQEHCYDLSCIGFSGRFYRVETKEEVMEKLRDHGIISKEDLQEKGKLDEATGVTSSL
ncbi:leucine-rich repeat and death domain-containing protein 1 [Vipera latastei]